LKDQVTEGVIKAVVQICTFVLHERLYLGLGAEFRFDKIFSRSGMRKLVLEMKLVRRRFEKLAKGGDDSKRPYYWRSEYPGMLAKYELKRIDRLIEKVVGRSPEISEADVTAFGAKVKKEVAAMEKRTKQRCTSPLPLLMAAARGTALSVVRFSP